MYFFFFLVSLFLFTSALADTWPEGKEVAGEESAMERQRGLVQPIFYFFFVVFLGFHQAQSCPAGISHSSPSLASPPPGRAPPRCPSKTQTCPASRHQRTVSTVSDALPRHRLGALSRYRLWIQQTELLLNK